LLQENKKINGKTFSHTFTKNSSGPARFRLVEKKLWQRALKEILAD
jgi:hypothetical protein